MKKDWPTSAEALIGLAVTAALVGVSINVLSGSKVPVVPPPSTPPVTYPPLPGPPTPPADEPPGHPYYRAGQRLVNASGNYFMILSIDIVNSRYEILDVNGVIGNDPGWVFYYNIVSLDLNPSWWPG